MRHIVFLLVPGVHLLDLAGPAQVFFEAADLGYAHQLHYVAERAEIPSAQGLALHAETTWPALSDNDLVLVPGWRTPHFGRPGPALLERLRAHHAAGGMVASVCSGADLLGKAGLLDGRRCTTHHELQDELAQRYPRADVVRDVLYVVDGRIATSAGIASGIDLALHLIAVRHGPRSAAQIARAMVVHTRRNGDEPQASVLLRYRSHVNETVHHVQDTIESRLAERLPLTELANTARASERTVTRLFTRSTGMTPLRYQQLLRVERAEMLIGDGATVEAAARAVGFADARMLRRLRSR